MELLKNEYEQRVEKAVRFIEDNLTARLTLERIAEQASFSKYHFLRIFSTVTGETVGSYVRKRRITRSADVLISTNQPILSIALDYQFDSQEAYTRSFKAVYKTTPGQYRKKGIDQIAFRQNELSEKRLNHLKTNISREAEVIDMQAKSLIGMSIETSLNNNRIPELWSKFMSRIHEIKSNKQTGRYGFQRYNADMEIGDLTEDMPFEDWATVEVRDFHNVPPGMKSHTLAGGKYARFIHRGGVRGFQMSLDYIYSTWFPASGYEPGKREAFQRYGERFFGPDHPKSELEVYVPIEPVKSAMK
ncbi:transcriptional regulator (AraC/XylS family) [Fulvivirga imtechensis AK7]|uniref:Transcriptional regulator (AraC/XylS family) n=1 Tax=Fulvivirga imtechensis AK7 TaxID=1237149 RepID=L8JQT1_9BACT|nr:AraC family transcriptional regulator [Fulvivirga imtechensis]ELR71210.1 transcriptional regulator (AraC/XylS family) [Fulvivirga imtechensis AK7]